MHFKPHPQLVNDFNKVKWLLFEYQMTFTFLMTLLLSLQNFGN